MQTIRCAFVDFWASFTPKDIPFLFESYNVIIDSDTPDYLFFSCFGHEHFKYNSCVKIFWSGENLEPDFNNCDYSISYSEIVYEDRAFRDHCCFNLYKESPLPQLTEEELLNRKFCNFIYSNNRFADPFRVRLFDELSKYKKVDSAGSLLNNVGFFIPPTYSDKIKFQSQYKFSLAIENSSMPGYTTEKIFHPFLAHSLPIYWGNPHIPSDFNPMAFINLHDFSSAVEMVEEIIRLDNDDDAYLVKVMAPFYPHGNNFEEFLGTEKKRLLQFYNSIFTQPLSKARRRTMYGRVYISRWEQENLHLSRKTLFWGIQQRIRRLILNN